MQLFKLVISSFILTTFACFAQEDTEKTSVATSMLKAPNGIMIPADYADWRVISISLREDNKTQRMILGNNQAVKAALSGKTNPWPDGAILAKLVWKFSPEERWPTALVPTKFVHVEFMFKDEKKWAKTGGWGYARWLGDDLTPYGKDKNFTQECVACHTPVKDRDWVYTTPAIAPPVK